MLFNLEAELIRKGYKPAYKAIRDTLNCSEKTARNKLSGRSDITVPEAVRIVNTIFPYDDFSIEYLFAEKITK